MQDANMQDIEKQINDVRTAQIKLKEAEKHLQDIKKKLELHAYITNEVLKKQDVSIYNRLKGELNVIPPYNEIEKILIYIVSILNPVKDTLDKKSYLPHLKSQTFLFSKQHFHEELSCAIRESQIFRHYKSFLSQFYPSLGGIEIPYNFFQEYLNFAITKNNWILAKYHKNTKFENLPDIFHETIIRPDLITVTFTFRKIEKSKNSDDVILTKLVYSTLFDKKSSKHSFAKDRTTLSVDLQYPASIDQDIKVLIQTIKRHSHKVCLPCTYPSLYIFQYFSTTIMEKIEQFWKMTPMNYKSQSDRKNFYEQILHNILKKYAEEMHATMQQKCSVCKKMMKPETLTQKMLPSIWNKMDKSDKTPVHHACKRVFELGKEIDEPKIILNIDATEDDDVNKYFN